MQARVSAASERATRSLNDGGRAYNNLARSVDPLIKSLQDYDRVNGVIQRAVANTNTTQAEGARIMGLWVDRAAGASAVTSNLANSFDVLGKQFVSSYSAALNYVDAIKQLQAASGGGKDVLGLYPGILSGIEKSYGLVGVAARQAAATIADSSKTAEERLTALQSLMAQIQQRGTVATAPTGAAPTTFADPGEIAAANRAIQDYAASITVLTAKYDPLVAATQQYQTALAGIQAAQDKGAISAETASQAQKNAMIPLIQAQAQPAVGTDQLPASFDKVYASSQAYAVQLKYVELAGKALGQTEEQIAAIQSQVTAAFSASNQPMQQMNANLGKHAAGTDAASFATRQLVVQLNQTWSSIATGQPVITVLLQQGHQIADVMISQGVSVRSLISTLGGYATAIGAFLITPIGLAITAVTTITAAIIYLGYSAESTARQHAGLALALAGVAKDYDALATTVKHAADEAGHFVSDTTADILTASKTIGPALNLFGQASIGQLSQMIQVASAVAQVMGTDLPAASKLMALSLTDPKAAIADLAKAPNTFELISAAALAAAQQLTIMGKSVEASRVLQEGFTKALVLQRNELTPLQQAWKDLKGAFTSTDESGTSLSTTLGTTINNAAIVLIQSLTTMVGWLHNTVDLFTELLGLAKSYANMPVPAKPSATPSTSAGFLDEYGRTSSGPSAALNQTAARAQAQSDTAKAIDALKAQYPSLFTPAAQGQTPLLGPTITIRDSQGNPISTNAQGLMQILPSTAASQLGATSSTIGGSAGGNLAAGLAYINQLYNQRGNELSSQTAFNINNAYGGAVSPEAQQGRNALITGAKVGNLPTDVAGGIALVGQIYGWPDWLIELAQKTAVVESGGKQFQGTTAPRVPTGLSDIPGGQQYGPQTFQDFQAGKGLQASLALPSQAQQVADVQKQIDLIKALRDQLVGEASDQHLEGDAAKANAAAQADQSQKIEQLTQKMKDLQDPTREAIIADRQRLEQLKLISPAAQQYLALQQQQDDANRKSGISQASAADQDRNAAQQKAALAAETDKLQGELDHTIAVRERDTDLINKQTEAYEANRKGGADQAIVNQAIVETMEKVIPGTANWTTELDKNTQSLFKRRDALDAQKIAPMIADMQDQEKVLQLEISTIGQDNDTRTVMIDLLKAEQDLRKQFPGIGDKAVSTYLAERKALDELNIAQKHQQAALDELAGAFTSAFDTISAAMAQAFVQGQGQAVNWGNVMKAVIQQVIAEFLKLAILNPLLNGLFGKGLTTLGDVGGLFGGGGGGGAGGILGGGLLPLVGAGAIGGFSPADELALELGSGGVLGGAGGGGLGASASGGGGWLMQALGLANTGSNLFGGGSGGLFSGLRQSLFQPSGFLGSNGPIAGFLNGGLFGTSGIEATALSTNAGIASIGQAEGLAGAQFGPATAAEVAQNSVLPTGLFGGASIGSLASGIGGGFGLGSLAGGFVQSSLGKTGPGPMIGAGGGAIAGAAIGSVIPVIGTIIGGLIGGLVGGAGGGLIGPKPASAYSLTNVGLDQSGMFTVGSSFNQSSKSQFSPSNLAQTTAEVNALNQSFKNFGVAVDSVTGTFANGGAFTAGRGTSLIGAVGQGSPKGGDDAIAGASSLTTLFSNMRFTANDPLVKKFIENKSFANLDALSAAVQHVETFVNQTVPALQNFGHVTGTLLDSLVAIHAAFDPAIATAQELGYAEENLTTIRDAAIAKANKAANEQFTQTAAGIAIAGGTANNQLMVQGSVGQLSDALQIALFQFDKVTVPAAEKQLHDSLTAIFGDTFDQSAAYAAIAAQQEQVLGQQRLVIQKAANDQIIAAEKALVAQLQSINVGLASARVAADLALVGSAASEASKQAALNQFDQVTVPQMRAQLDATILPLFQQGKISLADYVNDIAYQEQTLGEQRVAIIRSADEQIAASAQQTAAAQIAAAQAAEQAAKQAAAVIKQGTSIVAQLYADRTSLLAATAPSDAPGLAFQRDLALQQFDQFTRPQKWQDFVQSLQDTYGIVIEMNGQFGDLLKFEDQNLNMTRLGIAKQFNDQITALDKQAADQRAQQADSLVNTLSSYVQKIQFGQQSPLSPTDQYALAQKEFEKTSSSALAGNATSIGQLPAVSDALLAASRIVNGAGAGYATDFQKVLDTINNALPANTDQLTSLVFTSETRTQTDILSGDLADVKTLLTSIQTSINQNALRPARAAA